MELDGGGDTGFDKYEFMVKFRLNNDPDAEIHHRLDLKLGHSDERSHETYLGLTDEDFKRTPYRRYAASQMGLMEWGRYQVKLTYTTFSSGTILKRDSPRIEMILNAGGVNLTALRIRIHLSLMSWRTPIPWPPLFHAHR